jgi:hypothetical protein
MMCALLLLTTRQLAAQSPLSPDTKSAVEGTLGDQVLQLRYQTLLPVQPKSDLVLGLLLAEAPQYVLTGGVLFDTNFGVPGLEIEVGPQGYAGWLTGPKKTQVFAIAGGVVARYEVLRQYHLGPFISAFYSPSIVTFGQANNVYDFIAGGEGRITDRLTILAGYRWFKFTLQEAPANKVQYEWFGGLRWRVD